MRIKNECKQYIRKKKKKGYMLRETQTTKKAFSPD